MLTYLKALFIEVFCWQEGGVWVFDELEDDMGGRGFLSSLGLGLFKAFSFPSSESNEIGGLLTVSCEICVSVFEVRWTAASRGGGSLLGSSDIPTSD